MRYSSSGGSNVTLDLPFCVQPAFSGQRSLNNRDCIHGKNEARSRHQKKGSSLSHAAGYDAAVETVGNHKSLLV